jgi:hypothetical protein
MSAAEFLTEIVRGRIDLLQRLDQGAYAAAVEVGDTLAKSIVSHLETTDAAPAGALPHQLQLGALMADLALAKAALGQLDELPTALDQAQAGFGWLRDNAEKGLYFGGAVCRHGRPSMDGECLKRPPCSDG